MYDKACEVSFLDYLISHFCWFKRSKTRIVLAEIQMIFCSLKSVYKHNKKLIALSTSWCIFDDCYFFFVMQHTSMWIPETCIFSLYCFNGPIGPATKRLLYLVRARILILKVDFHANTCSWEMNSCYGIWLYTGLFLHANLFLVVHFLLSDYVEKPTYIRFLVSNAAAGSVIGKGGATISDFQSQSGARIQLSRNYEFFPGTSDRIIMISGALDDVIKAVELILAKLLSEVIILMQAFPIDDICFLMLIHHFFFYLSASCWRWCQYRSKNKSENNCSK